MEVGRKGCQTALALDIRKSAALVVLNLWVESFREHTFLMVLGTPNHKFSYFITKILLLSGVSVPKTIGNTCLPMVTTHRLRIAVLWELQGRPAVGGLLGDEELQSLAPGQRLKETEGVLSLCGFRHRCASCDI